MSAISLAAGVGAGLSSLGQGLAKFSDLYNDVQGAKVLSEAEEFRAKYEEIAALPPAQQIQAIQALPEHFKPGFAAFIARQNPQGVAATAPLFEHRGLDASPLRSLGASGKIEDLAAARPAPRPAALPSARPAAGPVRHEPFAPPDLAATPSPSAPLAPPPADESFAGRQTTTSAGQSFAARRTGIDNDDLSRQAEQSVGALLGRQERDLDPLSRRREATAAAGRFARGQAASRGILLAREDLRRFDDEGRALDERIDRGHAAGEALAGAQAQVGAGLLGRRDEQERFERGLKSEEERWGKDYAQRGEQFDRTEKYNRWKAKLDADLEAEKNRILAAKADKTKKEQELKAMAETSQAAIKQLEALRGEWVKVARDPAKKKAFIEAHGELFQTKPGGSFLYFWERDPVTDFDDRAYNDLVANYRKVNQSAMNGLLELNGAQTIEWGEPARTALPPEESARRAEAFLKK